MEDPRPKKSPQDNREDLASTSNDDRVRKTDPQGEPAPQGGKGTPSKAEGERKEDR